MNCESCGMPMAANDDHGGRDVNNKYCHYCTDSNGKLKTRAEIRAQWIRYEMKEGTMKSDAEKKVDAAMKKMKAWR